MKTLVIGDIHGCSTELMELLAKAGITEDDQISTIGYIVDRGPDSPAVLDFFRMRPGASSIMGNHERKHIRASRGEIEPSPSQILARRQFGQGLYSAAVAFMQNFPLSVELPEAILVHAFFEPGVPLDKQKETVLVGSISGEQYMNKRYSRAWFELYDGEKPIIAGHHDYSKVGKPTIYRDRVFLIDTGCCYGRSLTGLILPDLSIVSVKSRKNYWAAAMQSKKSRDDGMK